MSDRATPDGQPADAGTVARAVAGHVDVVTAADAVDAERVEITLSSGVIPSRILEPIYRLGWAPTDADPLTMDPETGAPNTLRVVAVPDPEVAP